MKAIWVEPVRERVFGTLSSNGVPGAVVHFIEAADGAEVVIALNAEGWRRLCGEIEKAIRRIEKQAPKAAETKAEENTL